MTLLLYESPQRFQRTLEDILEYWGDRRIAVARELTKLYEEVFRGTVSQARSHFSKDVKGEITIVVAGADETVNAGDNGAPAWPEELRRLMRQEGLSVKDATDRIAQQYMVPRREVYQEALRARNL
jgi:16S rRNA (cytidine1402-2'-O)-methyltransferase